VAFHVVVLHRVATVCIWRGFHLEVSRKDGQGVLLDFLHVYKWVVDGRG